MKIYNVVTCSCDYNQIGKTREKLIFSDRGEAEARLKYLVETHNANELARTDLFWVREKQDYIKTDKPWWRLFYPDKVEGIEGWVCQAYAVMLYIKEETLQTKFDFMVSFKDNSNELGELLLASHDVLKWIQEGMAKDGWTNIDVSVERE